MPNVRPAAKLRDVGTDSTTTANCPRILHVIPQLRPGGTEYALLRLIRATANDFEHRICATRGIDWSFAEEEGIADIVSSVASSGSTYQFPLFRLMRIMRQVRPHVVHSRNWGGIEAIFAARLAGVPAIVHSEHGYEVDNLGGLPWRRRIFRHFAYSFADAVFTNTRELRTYHAREAWTPVKQLRVLYNGVDTTRFAPDVSARRRMRDELGIRADNFVVGSVGRLVSIKDYTTLLDAVALLPHCQQLTVVLVGSGPENARLQKQASDNRNLSGRVMFAGASNRIPELMNAMDIFVLPSLGEGMSNTILEAMACGLPVLATRVGGNVELVEDGRTGFLFTPRDCRDLSSLIHQMLNPEARVRIGSTARERAVSTFSLERMVREYRDLYMELASPRQMRGVSPQAQGSAKALLSRKA